jgi:hypothetical protein
MVLRSHWEFDKARPFSGGAAAIVVLAATDAAVSIKVGCDENVLVHPSLEYEELMKKYKDPIDPKVLLLPKM